MELIVSEEKKDQYRVVRPWVGGPELGDVIDGPVHPAIRSHVELVRGKKAEANGDADAYTEEKKAEADKLLEDAATEAAKILDQARSDAEAILNGAKAEAEKIAAEANKPAPTGRR